MRCAASRAEPAPACVCPEALRSRYLSSALHLCCLQAQDAVNELKEQRQKRQPSKKGTDEFYSAWVSLRARPLPAFLDERESEWALPISSINGSRLLSELNIVRDERYQIDGLRIGQKKVSRGGKKGPGMTDEQLRHRALVRLAANPPVGVGAMQRRTAERLLRAYPHG